MRPVWKSRFIQHILALRPIIVYPCTRECRIESGSFVSCGKLNNRANKWKILTSLTALTMQVAGWCATALILSYAVNIVAAIAIIIVGMIIARVVSNGVNRLLVARHIDATVADFLSALVRYGIIAFTIIAALGRVGVQTASVIAVLGAAGLAVGLALQGSSPTRRQAYCW